MKKIIITIAISIISYHSYAQWAGTSPVYYNGGNVGIGTSSPSYPLTLSNSGETGILTINNGTSTYLSHGGWSMGAGKFGIGNGSVPTLVLNTIANGGSSVGNVGIGTMSPSYALQVEKTIIATCNYDWWGIFR